MGDDSGPEAQVADSQTPSVLERGEQDARQPREAAGEAETQRAVYGAAVVFSGFKIKIDHAFIAFWSFEYRHQSKWPWAAWHCGRKDRAGGWGAQVPAALGLIAPSAPEASALRPPVGDEFHTQKVSSAFSVA